jgi:hypothetical protein
MRYRGCKYPSRLLLISLLFCSGAVGVAAEFSKVLTDSQNNISIKNWRLLSSDFDALTLTDTSWSIEKRTLVGGRQEGVEVIDVDNGTMKFTVVPTRGFSVWSLSARDLRFGWDSPVKEIVHPQFVNLSSRGGLGWLDGFGGWMVRCGLESNGAPGLDGNQFLNLHGRIDYLPASYVEVRYEATPVPRIVLRGIVDESLMFGPHLRLTTEISTFVGSREVQFNDIVTNLADSPQEMELLYHVNFGPPLIGAGAEFVAPVKSVSPRDARAAEDDMNLWSKYQGPQSADYTEQVYLMELQSDRAGMTEVLLKSPDGTRGAFMRFSINELPYFTLWKNEAPSSTGYVTGLEPATNFPYPRADERAAGRVPKLQGGQSYRSHITVNALASITEVHSAESRIKKLQAIDPVVNVTPRPVGH